MRSTTILPRRRQIEPAAQTKKHWPRILLKYQDQKEQGQIRKRTARLRRSCRFDRIDELKIIDPNNEQKTFLASCFTCFHPVATTCQVYQGCKDTDSVLQTTYIHEHRPALQSIPAAFSIGPDGRQHQLCKLISDILHLVAILPFHILHSLSHIFETFLESKTGETRSTTARQA